MFFGGLLCWQFLSILFGLLVVTYYLLRKDPGHDNLPPGPRGVPFFGSLLTLANAFNPSKLLMEMGKKYGPVMTLRLGSKIAIVLTGYEVVREALVDKAEYFSMRPSLNLYAKLKRDKGLLFTSQFKERRRLALKSMRDFGLGKKSLDERMHEEAEMLVHELESSCDKPINLHKLLPVVTTNIICTIIRGQRFAYDDSDMQEIVRVLNHLTQFSEFHNAENYVSWAKYIPFMKIQSWAGERSQSYYKAYSIIGGWIDEHKKTFDNESIRDLIDLLLSECRKEDAKIKEENVLPIIWDLFLAGTETTSTTLLWSIAYLIIHEDIQNKCRDEIHKVVGTSKFPDYADSKRMPYLNSLINEVQRMANIVPMSLLHATSERVDFGGYTIPKGAIVIANLESALKDAKYWGDPYTFRPERWLDCEGNVMKKSAQIPFSTGSRECLGELLAKKELFLFLSSMLQNFEFHLEDEASPPDMAKGSGSVNTAPPYMVNVQKI